MAITVKLTDTTVKVGGEFKEALATIKAQAGRTYDPATKTWTVPMSLADFRKVCSLPMDVEDGRHITAYGNPYSRSEWDATKAARRESATAEQAVRSQHAANYETIDAELVARLEAINPKGAAQLAKLIKDDALEAAENAGRIKFSSPARRDALHTIAAWYEQAIDEAVSAEWADVGAAEAAVASKYF
jgi:hypothetical protein